MLQLKNITKVYTSGDERVVALNGIDLEFRKSEFVSILGPSGCGKTTLLNIIGGLDRYTKGDLIINGKSTKKFKDRDWDAYRNYSIGFVFQSYNLIGHQTVLSNVELALTISGVSKTERRQRAIQALKDVGLEKHMNKKPNQLSGGQMQRVAIARALVNNPDIILADEPTGALDTKTSVQIMEILKKISKDKLIIMVTHNPELANMYSSRIIKILDGKITDDSNPLKDKTKEKNEDSYRRTSMKFFTALRLSLNNLMTKKGRTILTSFAGSIGIIGIALILAISTGVQDYIDKIEEDTISSYPITIEESTLDLSSMMETMMGENKQDIIKEDHKIYSSNIMDDMLASISNQVETNNLKALKQYIESSDNDIQKYSNAIQYSYHLNLNLYDNKDEVIQVNPSTVMEKVGLSQQNNMFSFSMNSSDVWTEMIDNLDILKSQYDLLAGSWPSNYNEVVLIVNKDNEISDYTLYSLGLKDQKEIEEKMKQIEKGEKVEKTSSTSYTYEELLNLSYKILFNFDYYKKENGVWLNQADNEKYLKEKLKNAEVIQVVGIIRQNSEAVSQGMSEGIGYTHALTEYVIQKGNESDILKEQQENKDINIFSGLPFPKEGENEKFDYDSLTLEQKRNLSRLSSEEIALMMQAYAENQNASYENNLIQLGAIDIDSPSAIQIYPKDFDSKEKISSAIDAYNQKVKSEGKEENEIHYTDMIGTMLKSVSTIVNVISSILIAFVAISLVVSSIMIGIITYISVLERTKEIGILRAIGASKKDVSRVFKAETVIIGFISGVLGIGITMLLTIPTNAIISAVLNVSIITKVPWIAAIILIIISMILTIIGGLIPSRLASKKDPVIALRTE